RLAPDVKRQLLLAYTRTSLSFKSTQSNSVERARALGLSAAPILEAVTPKLDISKKTTESLATEASFLAYTDTDVEHDFLRIVSLLRRADPIVVEQPRPVMRWQTRRETHPAWRGQLVVVIDE